MDLKSLKTFIVVAETLNFSAAAKRLFISQPAVTKQIDRLEDELGYQLFKRNTRAVRLTPAGKNFYLTAQEVLIKLRSGIAQAKNLEQSNQESISIGYEDNLLNRKYLPLILKQLMHSFPQISFHLKQTTARSNQEKLLNGDVDLLFLIKSPNFQSAQIEFTSLYLTHFVCVISNQSSLAKKKIITVSDLQDQLILFLNPTVAPLEMSTMQDELIKQAAFSNYMYTDSPLTSCITIAANQDVIGIIPNIIPPKIGGTTVIPLDLQQHGHFSFGIAVKQNNKRRVLIERIKAKIIEFYKTIS